MKIGGANKPKPKPRGKTAPRSNVRQKKSDRLISGINDKSAIMCDMALAPVDRLADQMNRKWGIDVLPELVSPEMAMRYGSAVAKMNDAAGEYNVEETLARAEVCMRGLKALDAEAERIGAERASLDIWQFDLDGVAIGIMKEGRSWPSIREEHPHLEMYTMREVALALRFYKEHGVSLMVEEVKEYFPGAEMTQIKRKPLTEEEIPF